MKALVLIYRVVLIVSSAAESIKVKITFFFSLLLIEIVPILVTPR